MLQLFKLCFIVGLLTLIIVPILVLDASSRVATSQSITPQEAQVSKQVTDKIKTVLQQQNASLTITPQELNTVIKVFSYSVSKINADAVLNPMGLSLSASIQLDIGEFQRYLNTTCILANGDSGLTLDTCYLGDIALPGSWVHTALEAWLAHFMGQHTHKFWLTLWRNSEIVRGELVLKHLNGSDLKVALKRSYDEANGYWSNGQQLPNELIAQYYAFLSVNNSPNHSLANVIHTLFKQVQNRAKAPESLIEHNRAALWALAIRHGSRKFALLAKLPFKPAPEQKLSLAKRQDLALHFIYSAFIQLNSDQQTAFSIGELKELMDSNHGGSGFSFADLVADKAGVQFAEVLTSSHIDLTAKVNLLASFAEESIFMPNIENKPEGLSQHEFTQRFSNHNSIAYKKVLAAIEAEINTLPLYLN